MCNNNNTQGNIWTPGRLLNMSASQKPLTVVYCIFWKKQNKKENIENSLNWLKIKWNKNKSFTLSEM